MIDFGLISRECEKNFLRNQVWLKELEGKKILLTGATGFFGTWFLGSLSALNKLLHQPVKIVAFVRSEQKAREKFEGVSHDVEFIEGDLFRLEGCNLDVDIIIHAAVGGSPVPEEENSELLFDNIVEGTRSALKFAAKRNISSFLLISSGGVYGPVPKEGSPVKENYLGVEPSMTAGYRSMYSIGKRAAENLGVAYSQKFGFKFVSARCFAFVGPYLPMQSNFAIGNFIHDALTSNKIIVGGDGTPVRSYMYMSDLVTSLYALAIKGQSGEAYNVGGVQEITIEDLAYLIRDSLCPKGSVEVRESRPQMPKDNLYVPNLEKLNSLIPISEFVSLRQAIEKTASWYRNQLS
ncbi:MAG: NAD(P)-dependent oxidoreductase [Bdellovibrionales bacterium]|nr:NAD(P)-dependent oxidoreductase [Bdellovibrionales bacterium]